ncbi:hypothetical protein E1A91_A06G070200v1 [Gossypium mustelinum]|uniref:Transmembrane protein 234 homolog n=2 Tax=Gossypium mustelinum TaxID=34275 RepID=A0A5D2YTR0_GOSMU|nr:hypothetical protein E1A91_A06G070200v1 [Gossypium mustelinum]
MYKETMIGDLEKMLAVGLIWGATNAAMRRGALLWDRYLKSSPNSGDPPRKFYQKLLNSLSNWLTLLLFWQYSIPFFINLSASATFFAILGQAPISLAVPVTNATTFAATAVSGILLGEETRIGHTLLVYGVVVEISSRVKPQVELLFPASISLGIDVCVNNIWLSRNIT